MLKELTPSEKKGIRVALLVLATAVFLRTSWLSDDGMITLRSVFNFTHGYGPVFNVGERVQSFTHPLWFLLLSGMVWMRCNLYIAPLLLSAVASVITVWIISTKLTDSFWRGILLGCAAILSKAFIDYSSSGLENPLTHLIIVTAIFFGRRNRGQGTFSDTNISVMLLALIFLNRPDGIILTLPYAAVLVFRQPRYKEKIRTIFIASLLPLLWTLFSLIYYGLPLANTAYAKLPIVAGRGEIIFQGGIYLLDSFTRDPLTLNIIFSAIIFGTLRRRKEAAVACGIFAYVLYVFFVGGDFMSGRFLSLPFVTSLALLAILPAVEVSSRLLGSITIGLGLISVNQTLFSDWSYGKVYTGPSQVTDERGYYFPRFGLVNIGRAFLQEPVWEKGAALSIASSDPASCGGLGYDALHAGPNVHYIDPCGLVDPYVARKSMIPGSVWRPGHLIRNLPPQYSASILSGQNQFTDPAEHEYLDTIWLLTRGKIFSRERLKAIWRVNTAKLHAP